jgi:hypothetical protein
MSEDEILLNTDDGADAERGSERFKTCLSAFGLRTRSRVRTPASREIRKVDVTPTVTS